MNLDQILQQAAMSGALRCDAAESVLFARDLEHIYSRTYDILYPELRARQLVPPAPEPASPVDDKITYRQFNYVASSLPGADYSDDAPLSDVFGKEFSIKVRPVTGAYKYSIQELRASRQHNRPLDMDRARATRTGIETEIDRVILLGDSRFSIEGLFNHSSVDQADVADDGSAASKLWTEKTPQLIKRDILEPINKMVSDSKGVERGPWTCVLPISAYQLIHQTQIQDSLRETIAQWLLSQIPQLAGFEMHHYCADIGTSSEGRMVLYTRNPEKVHYHVPQEFEQLPPEARGFTFNVNCHARTAGIMLPYPKSIAYRDRITA